METEETHGLGYERVDDDPNVSVLMDTMGVTARWEATRRLRAWERQQLRLNQGQRLLDVVAGSAMLPSPWLMTSGAAASLSVSTSQGK